MKCYNLSRKQVINWDKELDPKENAWITIQEPLAYEGYSNDHVEMVYPMSDDQGKELVDFCLQHKDKNIYVNCMAGKCRSGAVCHFLETMHQYEWDKTTKQIANPNKQLAVDK